MRQEDGASYDYRFDKQNEILPVRWKDDSVCTMTTNYDTIEPLGVVKRWSPVQCEKINVSIPKLFQTCNKNMGGVDELDKSISLYRIAIHGKKWWCGVCHARVRSQCKKCLKTLCVKKQCFENFHL
ncbi:unnamed protein product [Euphydryas editha]|uniref:PiggyBac transposable element-derived protein domain-containing protein n=1 Tax=Euphydryas editha TaxID=104508 RepID=A0AAU9USA2_EUPED|nr:unnamed protein product [Euphydryas editha]